MPGRKGTDDMPKKTSPQTEQGPDTHPLAQEAAEQARQARLKFLEEENAQLRRLTQAVEQSANTVLITDLEGTIEYANPKFEESTGYSIEEALGKTPRILKSGKQDTTFYQDLWQTITAGQEWRGEFHNKRKDGTLFWERATIAPIHDASGKITHFVAVKEEITEQKASQAALNRYAERLRIQHEIDLSILAARVPETIAVAAIHQIRKLIPYDRAMVLAVDDLGQIEMLASRSSGETQAIVDTAAYQELLEQPTLRKGWVQGAEDLAALSQRTPLQQMLYQAGLRSYVVVPLFIQEDLVGTLNLESGTPQAFTADHIAIAIEVTASLAVAIRQARLYEQAQQEIAERMQIEATLREYAAHLEAQNAELDAFAHTVAHDLKNPVSTIVGYADVLNRNYTTLPEATSERFLTVIARNGRKLGTIIDELLLLASVREMAEIEIHPLEMGHVVAEARGRLLHMIEDSGGEIVMPDRWPVALGYAPWVEAVWTNYINNALKYGGQPPRVELGARTQEDGWVRFWVRDNGPGLTPEDQERLFTPFERLHQIRIAGQGLGLSIVRRIMEKLGGQVGVESDGVPGQGSTFYFTLPAVVVEGTQGE